MPESLSVVSLEEFYRDKVVLVTGAGSLGEEIISILLTLNPKTVRVFDNSEHALFRIQQRYGDKKMRYLLGDITDYDRVEFSMLKADYVIHTCANKFVDFIEYNPFQAINTNVNGTLNVIKAAMKINLVKGILYTSSDKACMPSSTYGLTKALGEKLFLWASKVSEKTFTILRLPNLMPSQGSVFEIWEEQLAKGKPLSITDERMRRWFIPIARAAYLTLKALSTSKGGEIYVPYEAEEHSIVELARNLSQEIQIIGKRLGERLTENLMSPEEKEKAECDGELWTIKN